MPLLAGKSMLAAVLAVGVSLGHAAKPIIAALATRSGTLRSATKYQTASRFANMRADRAIAPPLWPGHHRAWRAKRQDRGGACARTAFAANTLAANREGKSSCRLDRETGDWHRDRDDSVQRCAVAPAQHPIVVP